MNLIENIKTRHKLDEKTEVKFKTLALDMPEDASDPYAFTCHITADTIDRQDEVVIPDGGDLSEWLESGVFAYNHNYELPPVAFLDRTKKITRQPGFIEVSGKFLQRPEDHQGEFFPDTIRSYVKQFHDAGLKTGVSIGFIPLEARNPTKKDKSIYGETLTYVCSKWKMLECSFCTLQANSQAVVTAVGKGLLNKDVAIKSGYTLPETIEKTEPTKEIEVKTEEKKVIRCKMIIVLPPEKKKNDVKEILQKEYKRQLAKSWGVL